MIKAILWDNDGVLVDTERLYYRATKDVLAGVGFDLTEELFVQYLLIESRGPWHLLEGYTEEQIRELRRQRNERYSHYLSTERTVIDGVEEVLAELHGKYAMGIVTSSLKEHFEIIHASSGILKYFDFVVSAGDYTNYKPHPEPYLVAMQKAGVEPQECIAIEDSLRGVLAATGAGIRCYVVPHGLTRNSDFSQAYRVLTNLRELLAELNSAGEVAGDP
jgi:HAD superfamily hydrolase (TIGR01509 family)